jgi:hypothetical protein
MGQAQNCSEGPETDNGIVQEKKLCVTAAKVNDQSPQHNNLPLGGLINIQLPSKDLHLL